MHSKGSAILLISCPDKKGIVFTISNFIFSNNGNIVRSDQHADEESGTFFMRIEWDLNDFRINKNDIVHAFEPIASQYKMNWHLHFSDKRQRTAIFVSKMDHCLYDILLKAKEGELATDIACIISNHELLGTIAKYFNIPFFVIPKTKENKSQQELKELSILKDHDVDCIVLARYMQILSQDFVSHYPNKIINIHHSFLPAFKGAKPYHQAYQHGVKIIGATSHYVTELLDQGPIIEQDVIRVSHKDSIDDIIRKGKDIEKLVLSRAVRKHLEHKVLVYANKTIVFD
ncbi:MAG: formyltetrahydrofolate deformylase [Spirochaetes bacterium]|nr:formyltetrahydrofolate deformylase [Spirochaetota bacterium]